MKTFGNNTNTNDSLKSLLLIKQNILKNVAVADVVQVTSVSNTTCICRSLATGLTTEYYKLNDLQITKNDIVVAIFTDYDFRQNLVRVKNGNNAITLNDSQNLHQRNFGIIIGILYHKEES